jgi:predicted MPP superfamily phosphohydrolase
MWSKKMIIYSFILIVLLIFLYYENNSISKTNISLRLDNLPQSFNGYKIVQLSDLHEKEFGKGNVNLVTKVKLESPDAIFITGDLINATSNNNNSEKAVLNLLKQLIKISPVYYVTGNHEASTPNFQLLENKIIAVGVNVLRNKYISIQKGTDSLILAGIDDPEYANRAFIKHNTKFISKELDSTIAKVNENIFKILLTHRPEQLELYSRYNIDLIFAGHAHGGQIRLPFLGGIYVPNQGLLPKYTSGKYLLDNSTMIVSRGLGNTRSTLRLFNRPEIMITTLYTN